MLLCTCKWNSDSFTVIHLTALFSLCNLGLAGGVKCSRVRGIVTHGSSLSSPMQSWETPANRYPAPPVSSRNVPAKIRAPALKMPALVLLLSALSFAFSPLWAPWVISVRNPKLWEGRLKRGRPRKSSGMDPFSFGGSAGCVSNCTRAKRSPARPCR